MVQADQSALNAVSHLFLLALELVVLGQNPLGFAVFAAQQGDMTFKRFTFSAKTLIVLPVIGEIFEDFMDFHFEFFRFLHKVDDTT